MDRKGGFLESLKDEAEFFNTYKDRFVENFLAYLEEEVPGVLNSQSLRVLVRRIYSLVFSLRKDSEDEIQKLFYSLASHGVDVKKPLTKSLLRMVRDYIDYVMEQNRDHRRIKDLLELTDMILNAVETAYSRYLKELREKAGRPEERRVDDIKSISELIRKVIASGEEVELITYYKEVPVVCRTKVVESGDAEVTVERCDLNILREGEELYMKIRDLPRTIGVKVEDVDPRSERASLKVLGFVDLPQERRRFVRVVPKDPIPVHVEKGDWKGIGSMADVSVGGVGVYLKEPNDLKTGDVIRVRFRLPKGEVETIGSVRYVLDRGNVFRIGVQYELDLRQEDIVSDYVMERQFEILRELKSL